MSLSFEDKRVQALSARFRKIYAEAQKGMAEKVNSFFANFRELDEKKRALVTAGKLAEKEYRVWRQNKLLMGEKYKDLRDSIADNMLHANQQAAAVINHELPNVYAHNFNQVGQGVERKVQGYSFDLTNPETVRKLATDKTTLLPYKFIDGHRDVRWNSTKVNAQILQGILQGESADQMADRLVNISVMNRESALRNARTAVTSAQNKGRVDAMKQCEDDGVIMGKEWIATKDERTREAHEELDRVVVKVDEPFENSIGQIMYPGDPDADPANTYNCRCAIAEVVLGFKPKEQEEELNKELDETWDTKGDYKPAESRAEFIRENKDEMKADGVKGNELWAQYEGTMMHEAQDHLHEVSNEEAIATVREGIPDSYRRGWFVEADSEYKPKIEDLILGDPEVLNAGWNIAYTDFMHTVGEGSEATFEQFMYTPMSMFRGTSGQTEIAADVWSSFSMDRTIAEKFAGVAGKVEEIMIRPIDTWGAYQTTGEAEILVPRRMLEKLRGE